MKSLEQQVKGINDKLKELVKKHSALRKENVKLSAELAEYSKKETYINERISALELENSILKASAGKMDQREKVGFEKRINQYIKDLEQCMTMLNK